MIQISKYNKQNPLRVFEAFAGYGSQSLAFKYLKAEIINRGFHKPYQAINELCAEGKINWCKTLNDMAFTISKS